VKKHDVNVTENGFEVKPSKEYLDKQSREQRIADLKANPKANPSNKDIQQLLIDTNDRLGEIYELLKK